MSKKRRKRGKPTATKPPIRLWTVERLAQVLGVEVDTLEKWCELGDDGYRQFCITDRRGKQRDIADPRPGLKRIQRRIRLRLLRGRFPIPKYVHGGISGRTIKTAVLPHLNRDWVLTVDIKDCYPSISNHRVYRFWRHQALCFTPVARVLTRLTTFNGCLPFGAPTSLELLNCILIPVDRRIAGLCCKYHLAYTRWVDDTIISGPENVNPWYIQRQVLQILRDHKLEVAAEKITIWRASDGGPGLALGIDFSGPRPRVRPEYARRVLRDARDLLANAQGGPWTAEIEKRWQALMGTVGFIRLVQRRPSRNLSRVLRALRALRENA